MKFIFTILLFLITLITSAQFREVLTAEYKADFIGKDSLAYAAFWVNGVGSKLMPLSTQKFADGDAGLYAVLFRKANGDVYRHDIKAPSMVFMQYDTLGMPFRALSVECHLQSYYAVRSDGTIWMAGYNSAKQFSVDPQKVLTRWSKIPGQPAVKFSKVAKGGANGNGVLVALAENGDVWTVNDGSTVWVKKSLPGPVQRVVASESNFYIAIIDGMPYGWGQSRYLTGITGNITGYIALASYWGLTGKIIDIAVNGQTVHYIDDQRRLWGYGDNSMGEVGIGWELVNRRELYKGKQYVWGWVTATMSNYQQIAWVGKPQHILPGTLFNRVFGGGYYSFYWYAQDVNGNVYSCGRNKAGVLSNGLAVSNESDLPNWGDVTAPKLVNLNYVIPLPSAFVPGTVSAGKDSTVIGNSFTLIGSATPGRSKNFSYQITDWKWKQLSGASCIIMQDAPGFANIKVPEAGTYSFELWVQDNNGATMTDTVVVKVTIVNKPPSVEAYCNTTIGNSIILIGKATDADGDIVGKEWDKVAGPAGDTITDRSKDVIEVSFSQPGEYTYRFSAFDDVGASNSVDVTLIVYEVEAGVYIIIRKK